MTEAKEKIKHGADEAEKIVKAALKDEPETKKEARRRQPWMPIVGSLLAGTALLTIFALYLGWL